MSHSAFEPKMFPRSTILRRYGHQSLRVSIVRRHPSLSKQAQWGFHNAPRHSQFSRLSPAALLILSSRAAAAQLHNMAWSCGETHHRPQSLQQLQAPGARCRPPGARNTMRMSSAEALYWNSGTSSTTSSEAPSALFQFLHYGCFQCNQICPSFLSWNILLSPFERLA